MNEFDALPTVLTVAETAVLLRIGTNTCYSAVRRGEIPSRRIGGRIVIPKQSLLESLGVMDQGGRKRPIVQC